jgi:hypothetical protein
VLAEVNSWRLAAAYARLDCNKLDVLATWWLKTRRANLGRRAAKREWDAAADLYRNDPPGILPHQYALAAITFARAHLPLAKTTWSSARTDVASAVDLALRAEGPILAEADRLQGFRQFARICKNAGIIELALKNFAEGRRLLRKALALAEGPADTPDQANDIRRIMNEWGIE